MFFTYIIKSTTTGRYYIGSTSNIDQRIHSHNLGYTKSLKNKGPFLLVYKECFETRKEAYKREKQIKSYKSGEAFKKLING